MSLIKLLKVADDSVDITKASKNVEKISDVSKNITDKVEIPKIKPVENIVGTKTGNKELNNAINTRGKEYYANLQADKLVNQVTTPIDFDGHIINGEINARGRVVGGHSTAGVNNNVRSEHLHSVSSNGVRTANISVFDQNTNQWKLKVKSDVITP